METPDRYFLGRRMQLAFIVSDMEQAIDVWTHTLKVGPFVIFEHAMGDRHFMYRGERSPVDLALALSYVGDTQIELICPHNDAPSIYSDAMRKGLSGAMAHHMAFWPDDMDAARRELTRKGFNEVATIQSPAGEVDVYYFSSPAALGLILEIVPMNSSRRTYFGQIQAQCESADASQAPQRYRDKNHFLEVLAASRA